MKFLFKITSRSRPNNLKRTLENIYEMVSSKDFIICLTLDEDDNSVNNPEFKAYLESNFGLELHVLWGYSENKIAAINRNVSEFKVFDILVNVSDDQVFTVKNFDERIRSYAKQFANTDFFLHFPDSNHKPWDALCTLSIIGRDYYERDGYIYHPSYESVYCDNEAQEVAKKRNRYLFCPEYIFEHLHCAYGKAPIDAQYKKTENPAVHRKDKMNFERRKRNNFPA